MTINEMDTDVSATIQSKSYNESITRNRDVVKKMSDGVGIVCDTSKIKRFGIYHRIHITFKEIHKNLLLHKIQYPVFTHSSLHILG
jgi:hypothetical protein